MTNEECRKRFFPHGAPGEIVHAERKTDKLNLNGLRDSLKGYYTHIVHSTDTYELHILPIDDVAIYLHIEKEVSKNDREE